MKELFKRGPKEEKGMIKGALMGLEVRND